MKKIDPVTTEIIRNAFISIAQDMNATLIRSAYTPIIYEGVDCSVALLDEFGNVLGQSSGLPLFLANLEVCVKETAKIYGWDYFSPGDVLYVNNSYFTGTHLNDATVFAPIFYKGKRIGFSASRAHWMDVGGKDIGLPMDSVEIYQEGFRWNPVKVHEKGEPKLEIINFLKMNGRLSELLEGDLNAQIAAGKTGEKRLITMVNRYGLKTLKESKEEIFRQSEVLEKKAVRKIPDGSYNAEGFLDNDGISDEPIKIKINIKVKGDKLHVDLSGSSKQAIGPVNCGFAQTISAIRVAFKCIINPDRPVDGGTFKTLTLEAPDGSIFKAKEPAACAWYFSILGLLIDAFVKALAPVLKDKVASAHYGDSMIIAISGKDSKTQIPWITLEAETGGWGGFQNGDGADALINNVNGGFRDIPIEITETKFPLQIKNYGIRNDTGGAGKSRGGCGMYREFTMMKDSNLSLWWERSKTPAWGLFGGKTGHIPNVKIKHSNGKIENKLKVNAQPLKKGSTVTGYSGGGGGFGNPLLRDPKKVLTDVMNRYVSINNAKNLYGVIINKNLSLNINATKKLRKKMSK
tara:strand:- start:478 stop:2202 length:1725 start_codon:yes stop_codon:yes gene_type:complete